MSVVHGFPSLHSTGLPDDAVARQALFALGAGVPVAAGGAVRRRRVGADARRRVADAGNVALVRGRADDRGAAGARTAGARVPNRAGITIRTRRTVGLRRVRADTRRRVAHTRIVALVRSRADHRVAAYAAPRLAGVGLGTGVRVIARRPIRLRRVRADTRRRVAHTRIVALVRSRADHRVRSGAARPPGTYRSGYRRSCHRTPSHPASPDLCKRPSPGCTHPHRGTGPKPCRSPGCRLRSSPPGRCPSGYRRSCHRTPSHPASPDPCRRPSPGCTHPHRGTGHSPCRSPGCRLRSSPPGRCPSEYRRSCHHTPSHPASPGPCRHPSPGCTHPHRGTGPKPCRSPGCRLRSSPPGRCPSGCRRSCHRTPSHPASPGPCRHPSPGCTHPHRGTGHSPCRSPGCRLRSSPPGRCRSGYRRSCHRTPSHPPSPGPSRHPSPGCTPPHRGTGPRAVQITGFVADAAPRLAGIGLGTGVRYHRTPSRPAFAGSVQTPVAGLHTPASWHWSRRRADHRVAAYAAPRLAGVGLGTGVRVIARRPIRLRRVCADTRRRVARTRIVALVHAPCRSPGCRLRSSPPGRCRSGYRRSCHRTPSHPASPDLCRHPSPGRTHPPSWHWSEGRADHRVRRRRSTPPGRYRSGYRRSRHRTPSRSAFAGFEQTPVAGSHVPASWHWSRRRADHRVRRLRSSPPGRYRSGYRHSCHRTPSRPASPGSSRRPSPGCTYPHHGTGPAPCRSPGCRLRSSPPGRCRSGYRHSCHRTPSHRCRECRPSPSGSSRRPSPGCRRRPRGTGQRPCRSPGCRSGTSRRRRPRDRCRGPRRRTAACCSRTGSRRPDRTSRRCRRCCRCRPEAFRAGRRRPDRTPRGRCRPSHRHTRGHPPGCRRSRRPDHTSRPCRRCCRCRPEASRLADTGRIAHLVAVADRRIVTRAAVDRGVDAAVDRITGVVRADVVVVADQRRARLAGTGRIAHLVAVADRRIVTRAAIHRCVDAAADRIAQSSVQTLLSLQSRPCQAGRRRPHRTPRGRCRRSRHHTRGQPPGCSRSRRPDHRSRPCRRCCRCRSEAVPGWQTPAASHTSWPLQTVASSHARPSTGAYTQPSTGSQLVVRADVVVVADQRPCQAGRHRPHRTPRGRCRRSRHRTRGHPPGCRRSRRPDRTSHPCRRCCRCRPEAFRAGRRRPDRTPRGRCRPSHHHTRGHPPGCTRSRRPDRTSHPCRRCCRCRPEAFQAGRRRPDRTPRGRCRPSHRHTRGHPPGCTRSRRPDHTSRPCRRCCRCRSEAVPGWQTPAGSHTSWPLQTVASSHARPVHRSVHAAVNRIARVIRADVVVVAVRGRSRLAGAGRIAHLVAVADRRVIARAASHRGVHAAVDRITGVVRADVVVVADRAPFRAGRHRPDRTPRGRCRPSHRHTRGHPPGCTRSRRPDRTLSSVQTLLSLQIRGVPGWQTPAGSHTSWPLQTVASSHARPSPGCRRSRRPDRTSRPCRRCCRCRPEAFQAGRHRPDRTPRGRCRPSHRHTRGRRPGRRRSRRPDRSCHPCRRCCRCRPERRSRLADAGRIAHLVAVADRRVIARAAIHRGVDAAADRIARVVRADVVVVADQRPFQAGRRRPDRTPRGRCRPSHRHTRGQPPGCSRSRRPDHTSRPCRRCCRCRSERVPGWQTPAGSHTSWPLQTVASSHARPATGRVDAAVDRIAGVVRADVVVVADQSAVPGWQAPAASHTSWPLQTSSSSHARPAHRGVHAAVDRIARVVRADVVVVADQSAVPGWQTPAASHTSWPLQTVASSHARPSTGR